MLTMLITLPSACRHFRQCVSLLDNLQATAFSWQHPLSHYYAVGVDKIMLFVSGPHLERGWNRNRQKPKPCFPGIPNQRGNSGSLAKNSSETVKLTAIFTVKTPPLDSITFLICSRISLSFVRPSARSNVFVVITYNGGAIRFICNITL